MSTFEDRIWAVNHGTSLDLVETSEGLELRADVGDESTTVVFDLHGVANLRRALQRYERRARRADA